jgi:hypothetical protein
VTIYLLRRMTAPARRSLAKALGVKDEGLLDAIEL